MSGRRRLSDADRLEINREAAKGVSAQELAKRFGVTARTIRYTVHREKHRRRDTMIRTKTISVTLTPEELATFEAVLAKNEITNRSDGVRRLIQAANGIFQPDDHLASELSSFRGALNRVGNNVSQIAKRMNEANKRGQRPPFSASSLDQVRGLARFVLDCADEIHLLVRRRTDGINIEVSRALKELVDGAE